MSKSSEFLDRTFSRLRSTWTEVSRSIRNNEEFSLSADLNNDELEKLKDMINRCLQAPSGEVSARALAARIGQSYISMSTQGRGRFLSLLANDYDVDDQAVKAAIDRYLTIEDTAGLPKARAKLMNSLQAPRLRLLTQFNALPEGVKFLVDLRQELLEMNLQEDSKLACMEKDLKRLLAAWFDIGFLKLEQITWNSPASLLEKLIEYEAVHEIASWNDLKNRLDTDRRLFAFIHPNMPEEPLIFVQVALLKGLADNIQELLDPHAPITDLQSANTAIFYSISNAQRGLEGISLGNYLIKKVVASLKREFPNLKKFATLSPVPGFMPWLDAVLEDHSVVISLNKSEQQALDDAAVSLVVEPNLRTFLAMPDWHLNPTISNALKAPLMKLCCHYLLSRKGPRNKVVNPVAHFHLSNGATIQRINWLADSSEKGLIGAAGLMVNYLYDLENINVNSESYSQSGEVAMSSAVKGLM